MNKAIIVFGILIAAFVYAEATQCRSHCRNNVHSPIQCVKTGAVCRKMKQCSIKVENCRRQQERKPLLTPTSAALCRNIKGRVGKGRCAIKNRKPRSVTHPRCHHINCPAGSDKLNCYSDRRNKCQLLTPCQVERANCLRGRNNLLEWVDLRRCAGMHAGQILTKCRPGPRRS